MKSAEGGLSVNMGAASLAVTLPVAGPEPTDSGSLRCVYRASYCNVLM